MEIEEVKVSKLAIGIKVEVSCRTRGMKSRIL